MCVCACVCVCVSAFVFQCARPCGLSYVAILCGYPIWLSHVAGLVPVRQGETRACQPELPRLYKSLVVSVCVRVCVCVCVCVCVSQVHILEDEEGKTGFRNLNIHRANNEEEALNLVRVCVCVCVCVWGEYRAQRRGQKTVAPAGSLKYRTEETRTLCVCVCVCPVPAVQYASIPAVLIATSDKLAVCVCV